MTSNALGTFQPYKTAQATVAQALRRAVLSGQLPPGFRLLQDVVAKEMQTSTTPVREALRELSVEGLLDLDPNRGVVVHQASAREMEEIYLIRMLLEPVAIASTVARITAGELKEAEEILLRLEAESDVAEFTILNTAFHAALTAAARQPILSAILGRLRNISAIYIAESLRQHPERIAVANVEHRALFDACAARDSEGAQAVEIAHLRHTLEMAPASIKEDSAASAGTPKA